MSFQSKFFALRKPSKMKMILVFYIDFQFCTFPTLSFKIVQTFSNIFLLLIFQQFNYSK